MGDRRKARVAIKVAHSAAPKRRALHPPLFETNLRLCFLFLRFVCSIYPPVFPRSLAPPSQLLLALLKHSASGEAADFYSLVRRSREQTAGNSRFTNDWENREGSDRSRPDESFLSLAVISHPPTRKMRAREMEIPAAGTGHCYRGRGQFSRRFHTAAAALWKFSFSFLGERPPRTLSALLSPPRTQLRGLFPAFPSLGEAV